MLKIGEVTKLQRVFLRHSVVFSSLVKSLQSGCAHALRQVILHMMS